VDEALKMGALRVSFGWGTEAEHVDRFLDVWRGQVAQMCTGTEAF